MANIKLNGKEYELKFTYKAILTLEDVFGMGIGKIFTDLDMDKLSVLNTFVYACLKRHKDFENTTVEEVTDLLDEGFESETLTFEQLTEAVKEAVEKSVIAKGADKGNGKKTRGK